MLHARLQGDGRMGLKAKISQLPTFHTKENQITSTPSLLFGLFTSHTLSLFLSTRWQQLVGYFKSNSDFHFPMSLALVMNHGLGLGFQVGTRLHISKSKSDFSCLSLLGSNSKPSSLFLINVSLLSVLYSLCSLLISKPLLFILKQILLFLYIKTVAGCCCHCLTAHLTSSSSLHGSSQALSLGFLVLDQVKKISLFIPLFRYFVFMIWVYHFVQMIYFLICNKNHMKAT